MIKEVHIQNFLSHKNTTLEFSPGLNIIVGESDTGKSAIVRALRWIILNRPTGDSFRSNWGGQTSVHVSFDDVEIVRYKNEKENAYGLVTNAGVDLFKAIRTDVPDEIRNALQLDVNNVQTQFESHFLLSSSPGEIAHHFNKIAHLDRIDIGIGNIKKWIGVAGASITAEEGSLDRLGEELLKYSNIDIIEEELLLLEDVGLSLESCIDDVFSLSSIIVDFGSVTQKIEKYDYLFAMEAKVNEIISYIEQIEELDSLELELENFISELVRCSRDIRKEQDLLESEEDVDNLLGLCKEITQFCHKEEKLLNTINYIERTLSAIEQEQLALNLYEDQWHTIVGEVCPVCGNEIT